jgi:hypothetical protein
MATVFDTREGTSDPCPKHAHVTDAQLAAMTEVEACACDWLHRRWCLLQPSGHPDDVLKALLVQQSEAHGARSWATPFR